MSTLFQRFFLSRSLSCPHRGRVAYQNILRRRFTTPASEPNNSSSSNNRRLSMWQKFTSPKEIPPRGTFGWYREMALICTVFGITGSSTMMVRLDQSLRHVNFNEYLQSPQLTYFTTLKQLVRPAVSDGLGIKGSMREGPWSYRICSVVIMSPIYATLLVFVGTIFGRHAYFRQFSVKIFSRFGIPPELMDKNYHANKKHFRKW